MNEPYGCMMYTIHGCYIDEDFTGVQFKNGFFSQESTFQVQINCNSG